MEEDNIIKKKKNKTNKNYYQRHNKENKRYSKNKKKKNLLLENTSEIANILLYNEQSIEPKEETVNIETPQIPIIKVDELVRPTAIVDDDVSVVPSKKKKDKINLFNGNILKYGMSFAVLLLAIFGVSYSYFNYTKIDSRQADISSGDVYVTLVENATSISLPKMYPRTDEEARGRNDNYFDFTIKAKNTSETKSVLYTINIGDGEAVSGKTRIDPQYIKVDLQEKINNEYVYIKKGVSLTDYSYTGVVLTNTTSEITREFRLRIWIGDNVTISDTIPNASYTRAQFNNLYATYNVEVNSEDKVIAYSMFSDNADTETVINFANASSSSNGEGLYRLLGTENDAFPIYYYRGEIDNNNVIFGDYCWQIVRTTETGGIKMIYNGLPNILGSGENITYNCGATRDIQNTIFVSVSLNNYYYADDYEIVSTRGNSATYRLKSKTNPITQVTIDNDTDAATKIPIIVANYPYTCAKTTSDATCTKLYKIDHYDSGKIAKAYSSQNLATIGRNRFNIYSNSLSDVGYMYNQRYNANSGLAESNSIFGKNVEWNGSSYLVIEDITNVASTNTIKDSNHHYSCGTSGATTCSTVRYYYYSNNYITLSGGDTIEDAIYKMTGNGSYATKAKNSGYVLNQNDSLIKTTIDNWFRLNLTNEANTNNQDYSVYLEDTVFCNDRSFKTIEGGVGSTSYPTYENSGWNPNGGDLTQVFYFGTNNRFNNSWYSTTNVPSMMCPNESDKFSVNNDIAHLKYPVGLLTADELVLAGVGGNNGGTYNYYLYTSGESWTLTPYGFNGNAFFSFIVRDSYLGGIGMSDFEGVRPVVSLKLGTQFEPDGDGTPTNPYVVKYN